MTIEILCTDKCVCPVCGTKNYRQLEDANEEYPLMKCENGHVFWSD